MITDPIKDNRWAGHPETGVYYADSSELQGGNARDPWGRPLPDNVTTHRNREGEITHWTTETTVRGTPVILIIFND